MSADGEPLSKVVLRSLQPHIERGLVQLLTEEDEQREAQRAAGSSGRGGGGGSGGGGGWREMPGPMLPGQWGPGRGEVVRARLSDPEGFLMSNDIISDVFAALDPDGGPDSDGE